MNYLESIFKGYKTGEFDKIFIFIYSNFVVGYLILFTTYEKSFLNLELTTQIILSVGISFPILLLSSAILARNKTRENGLGGQFQLSKESAIASIMYSLCFSFLYILKIMVNFDNRFSPILTFIVIMFMLLIFYRSE